MPMPRYTSRCGGSLQEVERALQEIPMAVEVDGTDNDALAVGGVLQGDARRHQGSCVGICHDGFS